MRKIAGIGCREDVDLFCWRVITMLKSIRDGQGMEGCRMDDGRGGPEDGRKDEFEGARS